MNNIYFVIQIQNMSLWIDTEIESNEEKDLEEELKAVQKNNPNKNYRIQQRIKNQFNPKRKSCC